MDILVENNVVLLYQWSATPPELVLKVAVLDTIEEQSSQAR